MDRWDRFVSAIGGRRLLLVLGGLYVTAAVLRTIVLLWGNATLPAAVGRLLLLGAPGFVLLTGGYRLPEMDLHPAVHPRLTGWVVGGLGVMAGVLATIVLISASGLDKPIFSTVLGTGLGCVGGFAAGTHDARARTRAHELEGTVEELQMSNERLEQFAYAASHDLQEPLRMVSSYLQLLEERHIDDLDEEALEYIDFAVDGADRMQAMVENLLEYSRVSTSGDPLEPVDAGAVLDRVLQNLELRIEETDATITTDELPTVTADADQLAQVFQNLISNALAHCGADPPSIHVSVERVDDEWQFSVADEGVGIDPDHHDSIFDIFEQVHTEGTDQASGSGGIGLALCERIVERHGGDIWVESTVGEGTTFYFTCPTAPEQGSTAPSPAPEQESAAPSPAGG